MLKKEPPGGDHLIIKGVGEAHGRIGIAGFLVALALVVVIALVAAKIGIPIVR